MNKVFKNIKKWQIVLISSLTGVIVIGTVVGVTVPLVNSNTYKRVNLESLKLDQQSIAWGAYSFKDTVNKTVATLNDKYNLNIKADQDLKFKIFLNDTEISEQALNNRITQTDFLKKAKITIELTAATGSFTLKANSHQTYEFKIIPINFHALKFNPIYAVWSLNSFQDVTSKFITDNFGNSLDGHQEEYTLKLDGKDIPTGKIPQGYAKEKTHYLTIRGTDAAKGAILNGEGTQGSTVITVQKLDLNQLKSKIDLSSIQWITTYKEIEASIIGQINTLVVGTIESSTDVCFEFYVDGNTPIDILTTPLIDYNNIGKDLQIKITGTTHSFYIDNNSITLNKTIPKLNLGTIKYKPIILLKEGPKTNLNEDKTLYIKKTVIDILEGYIRAIDKSFEFSFDVNDFDFTLNGGSKLDPLLTKDGKIYIISMTLKNSNPFIKQRTSFKAQISAGQINLNEIKINSPEINFINTYQKMIDVAVTELQTLVPSAREGVDFSCKLYYQGDQQDPISDLNSVISFNNINKDLILLISAIKKPDHSEIFKNSCKINSTINKIDLSQPNALPNLTKYLNNSENFDANDSIASFKGKVTSELKKEVINNDNITNNLDLNLTQNKGSFTVKYESLFRFSYWTEKNMPIGAKDLQLTIGIAAGKTNNYFMNQTQAVYNVNVKPTLKFNDKIKTIFTDYMSGDYGYLSSVNPFVSASDYFSDIIDKSKTCLSELLPGTETNEKQYNFNLSFIIGGTEPETINIDPKYWKDAKNELKINKCLRKICDTEFEKDRGDEIEIEIQLKDTDQIGKDKTYNNFKSKIYVL